MALCRLSSLVLLKSMIYPVFYYSGNSTVTDILEYLIPRMELMERLPRYMGGDTMSLTLYPAVPGCPIPPSLSFLPMGWVSLFIFCPSVGEGSKLCYSSH